MTEKTCIDWLAFRCWDSAFKALELMRSAFGTAGDCLALDTGLEPKDGWKRAAAITMGGDIQLGRVDYEGDSQRGWVRVILTGEGCSWVQDWDAVAGWGSSFDHAEIRRLDIALTTYEGEVSHRDVVEAYAAREFSSGAGRPPVMKQITSSDDRAGKTVYIGQRTCAKFLRCYEKGFELLKDIRSQEKEKITHIGGDRVENIYRVEVEFKAIDKVIPWAAVTDRDSFFAGAYPFCGRVIGLAFGRKMESLPSFKPVVALENSLENCRISYGAILRTALNAFDGNRDALLNRVLAENQSDALVRAGVLTVAHTV